MLSAADAIARAKGAPKITPTTVASAIAAKYPDKKMRFEEDLYGYDEPWLNPATGKTEIVFIPVMHASLLETLG
jgi:hypothetical protein